MALHGRKTLTTISDGMRLRRYFKVGNVTGCWFPAGGETVAMGKLPDEWRSNLRAGDGSVYVVYSYQTPIAWTFGDGWTVPPVKYSVTTTGHQNVIKVEIDHPGHYARVMENRPARTVSQVPGTGAYRPTGDPWHRHGEPDTDMDATIAEADRVLALAQAQTPDEWLLREFEYEARFGQHL